MDKKVADRPATPRDVAALGDGGGVTSLAGTGVVGVVVPLGGVAVLVLGVGAEPLLGEGAGAEVGVAVLLLTLMASFWPWLQWPAKVQMKKISPVVLSVILTGGFE